MFLSDDNYVFWKLPGTTRSVIIVYLGRKCWIYIPVWLLNVASTLDCVTIGKNGLRWHENNSTFRASNIAFYQSCILVRSSYCFWIYVIMLSCFLSSFTWLTHCCCSLDRVASEQDRMLLIKRLYSVACTFHSVLSSVLHFSNSDSTLCVLIFVLVILWMSSILFLNVILPNQRQVSSKFCLLVFLIVQHSLSLDSLGRGSCILAHGVSDFF